MLADLTGSYSVYKPPANTRIFPLTVRNYTGICKSLQPHHSAHTENGMFSLVSQHRGVLCSPIWSNGPCWKIWPLGGADSGFRPS